MPFDFREPERVAEAVVHGFLRTRVLVIGDLMLDRYVYGDVTRISPEAPVPVVSMTRETANPGGAANVAQNAVGLGCRVSVAGFVGQDEAGDQLLSRLSGSGVDCRGVLAAAHPTTVKTRIMGGHQQMLRLDSEARSPYSPTDVDALAALIDRGLRERPDVVILSDYAKGTLSERVCEQAIAHCRDLDIPVLVDPKGTRYAKYARATAISPNRAELMAATGETSADLDRLVGAAQQLRESLAIDFLIFTRSEQGITLVEPGAVQHAPAAARDVFDVSGAGDTVIATTAAGLACGLERMDAVRLANVAAGIVVGKLGTVPIARAWLLDALREAGPHNVPGPSESKLYDLESALQVERSWRAMGDTIVFTNGVFDILHAGHVAYLEQAKQLGSRLIVGLNTDASVRRIKGSGRPVNAQSDRARVLAGLASVDLVVIFGDDTPLALIRALHPDVLVKGADYTIETVVGASDVQAWGGRVALIPMLDGRSTTGMLERLRDAG